MKGYAFHFVGDTLRDGRPVPADGEWLVHDGPVKICESGLHFSYDAFDALQYASGKNLCLVRVDDVVATESDKGVCRRRMIVARFDATQILRYFARMQALSVIHLWETCPPDVVLDYLMTGNESLREASWEASREASSAASSDQSWVASRAASWASSSAPSRVAGREAQRLEFNSIVLAEFQSMGAL